MVAYSFQRRFMAPIREGRKTQTIRARGKRRHARPGEQLQLYVDMRTRYCELIERALCTEIFPVHIIWLPKPVIEIEKMMVAGRPLMRWTPVDDLDAFAVKDGFDNLEDMRQFWKVHHPDVVQFDGVLILWQSPQDRAMAERRKTEK